MRTLIPLLALLVLLLLPVPRAEAQALPGSRYFPLDHWAYDAIERLRVRGRLPGLDPLRQPYRRIDVAHGLRQLPRDELTGPEEHWVGLLEDELARDLDRLRGEDVKKMGLQGVAGLTASTSRRLDPLLPFRTDRESSFDNRAWPFYGGGVWLESGGWTANFRLFHDLWKEDPDEGDLDDGDPDGIDPDGLIVGDRTDDAYLTWRFERGELFLGRMRRNWSAVGSSGLMLSGTANSYPQVGLKLAFGDFGFDFFHGELETLDRTDGSLAEVPEAFVEPRKRYFVAHRLSWSLGDLHLAVGEGNVYAPISGGPSLRFLNPVEFLFFDHDAEPKDVTANLALNAQLWYRGGPWVLTGEFVLDDVDVTPPEERETEPFTYAGQAGVRYVTPLPWLELQASYKRVSAFSYRTPAVIDVWTYLGRGIGDNFSDYDRLTLQLDWFTGIPGLRLSPTVQYQRKGEGSLRELVDVENFLGRPDFLLGTSETTTRLALRGRYQPSRYFYLEWDAGENFVTDREHVEGDDVTEFSAVARFAVTLELPGGWFR